MSDQFLLCGKHKQSGMNPVQFGLMLRRPVIVTASAATLDNLERDLQPNSARRGGRELWPT